MFLKELELIGFKSFPDKTTLKFESGITAIVGPNGCGKSNIFDSIRWVLGEQSTKALRGIKMEDIIFNGTDSKPSLGMAEVNLVFSNKSRKLSLDCDEITVCRRIFRSGESQYLLNKAPVRLKDIMDLFMGTGIGAESYSLVEQGKIGLILSTRPEERRLIFDEASGITKYKSQKKETLRKLDEAEQNLVRINDITTEVRREIKSLERQANKARRYKETFEQLKNKEANLANAEILKIEEQKQGLCNKINISQGSVNSNEEGNKGFQNGISLRLERIQQIETEIFEHREHLTNTNNLITNNDQRIQTDLERINELNARIQNIKQQRQLTESRIEASGKNIENAQKEYNDLKTNTREKETLFNEKQKQYEQANISIESQQNEIKQVKERILDLAAAGSHIKNELADLQAQLKSSILRKKRLDIEAITASEEKENLNQLLRQQISELDSINQQLIGINAERQRIKDELTCQFNTQEKLRQDIQNLENEKITLISQKEFLQELKLKYENINQSLNAVLYLDQSPGENVSGIIVRIKGNPEKGASGAPEGLTYKLSGEAKPMPLETQAIEQRLGLIETEITKKQQDQQLNHLRTQELNQNLHDLDQKAKNQEILISNKSLQKDNLTQQLDRIIQEYEVVNIELQDLESQITQFNNRQTESETKLSETTQQQNEAKENINSLENSIADFRSLREEILIKTTQIKTEIENQNQRLIEQEKTQSFLENAFRENQQLCQGYLEDIQQSESKIKELSNETESLRLQNREANENKIKLTEEQNKHNIGFKELTNLQQQDNQQVLELNQNIERLKKEIYDYQMQVQEHDFSQRSIRDRIGQIYKVNLEKDFPSSQVYDEQDKKILTAHVAELKQKIDSLGTVNLIAIEEYEELKKRYDFLTQQQDDLTQARISLNEAINKINKTTRQMFLDTFKSIQTEFRNYFRLLFGGGQGQILLNNESDPLESAIEIICRPPGKKLQNVLALSGGEKSLSAVALIFAIFKVKPAPFCILDEVDAALDEVNISRFSTMLREFGNISQFLVITHNKRTIVNSDVMYGITMQEPGISKIVSVKFAPTSPPPSQATTPNQTTTPSQTPPNHTIAPTTPAPNQATAPSQQTTPAPSQATTNQATAPSQATTNQATAPSQATTNQATAPSQATTNQATAPSQATTNQATAPSQATTNQATAPSQQTTTPAPSQQTTPAPSQQTTPAPSQQTTPAPSQQTTPAPSQQTTPAPSQQQTTPAPSQQATVPNQATTAQTTTPSQTTTNQTAPN